VTTPEPGNIAYALRAGQHYAYQVEGVMILPDKGAPQRSDVKTESFD
jgi:hypothetical protein